MNEYDVIVVGSGPAGLAAATEAKKNGANKVLVLEREKETGGILNQCIHDGFGLIRYHKQLSGPEYANRALNEALEAGVEVRTSVIVTDITREKVITAVCTNGLENFKAKAIVLGLGCRERTRGALMTPGTRPAGVYTAGVAQNLINTKNIMVGKKVVILGSGDVGLIMARRLTLEGAKVLAVAEIMKDPCGLARNVQQCLFDFGIPLYLSHTVSNIYGNKRLEGVDISKVDEKLQVIEGTKIHFDCDTLVLSVGLIPENEVSQTAGVEVARNNGAITDSHLMTNVPGIFACGNSRSVMDLADFVSMQGEMAGRNAAKFIQGLEMSEWKDGPGNTMKKGLPEEGSITCTFCPNGCQVKVNPDGSTSGNKCERGKRFALQEQKCPERVLTTTVRVNSCEKILLPVRSDKPVRLEEMAKLAREVSKIKVNVPVVAGDVVATGLGVNKVNMIAGQTIEK